MKTNISTFLFFIGIFVFVGCSEDDDIDYCKAIEESDGPAPFIPEDGTSCTCDQVRSSWDYGDPILDDQSDHVPQLYENAFDIDECRYRCSCSGSRETKWHCNWGIIMLDHPENTYNPCILLDSED